MKMRYKRKIGDTKWHDVFLWLPVKIDGYVFWGQKVRRRNIAKGKTVWAYTQIRKD